MSIRGKERLRRIYLVGFMGVGKTTVGEHLARELGYPFADLDREIESATHKGIPEIFRDEGEPRFREIESAALRSVSALPEVVVACGGGTLTLGESRELIRRSGISVWLDAPLEILLARCRTGDHRPLLADDATMEALLRSRLPAYRESVLRVDVSSDPPEEIARRIAYMLTALG